MLWFPVMVALGVWATLVLFETKTFDGATKRDYFRHTAVMFVITLIIIVFDVHINIMINRGHLIIDNELRVYLHLFLTVPAFLAFPVSALINLTKFLENRRMIKKIQNKTDNVGSDV